MATLKAQVIHFDDLITSLMVAVDSEEKSGQIARNSPAAFNVNVLACSTS